jgi:predicted transcriptional regulator
VTNYPHVEHSSSAAVLRDYVLLLQREGQSLEAIGRTLGVSHAAISQWLAGKRQPSRTVLILVHLLSQRNSGTWPM